MFQQLYIFKNIFFNQIKILKRPSYIIIPIALFVYILPLTFRPLYTPDETRYAEIAREIIESGDWISPHLDGLRYFEKPIMGYWLNAVSLLMFGETRLAVRFSSAFATLLTALAVYLFTLKLNNSRHALISTVIYLTSALVYLIGSLSLLDAPFNLFLTVCMFSLVSAVIRKKFNSSVVVLLVICGTASGCAFLTKGFLAFAFPMVALLPFLIWEKCLERFLRLLWIPFVMLLVTTLPWCIMIHYREPSFWNYFFWVEHVQRFLNSDNSQHPQPFWFFIPTLIVGILPWLFLFPCLFKGFGPAKWHAFFSTPLLRYSACALVFPFLMLSCSSGKLVTYILPVFPPLAIIIGALLDEHMDKLLSQRFIIMIKVFAWIMAMVSVVVLVFGVIILVAHGIAIFSISDGIHMICAGIGFGFNTFFLIYSCKTSGVQARFAMFSCAVIPVMIISPMVMPQVVLQYQSPEVFVEQVADRITPDTKVYCCKQTVNAVCWKLKRKDVTLLGKAGELSEGIKYNDAGGRFIEVKDFTTMVECIRKGDICGKVALFCNRDKFDDILPTPSFRLREGPNRYWEFEK